MSKEHCSDHDKGYSEADGTDLRGVDWADDSLFFTYAYEDETSAFDPNGKWCYGGEYYALTIRCRVPLAFKNCQELIDEFIEMMCNKWPDCDGFYVPAKGATL